MLPIFEGNDLVTSDSSDEMRITGLELQQRNKNVIKMRCNEASSDYVIHQVHTHINKVHLKDKT